MIIALASVALAILLVLRTPIGVATGLVGICGLAAYQGWKAAFSQVGIIASETVLTYEFAVIPLFIVMGAFIAHSGIAGELFRACYALVGHLRGGLALSTIVACGGFGAVSGSSLATAATMSRIAYPQMKSYGYRTSLATGSIAAGGTLGILIPPSIALVFYGIMTETDIGALFMAGIVPGILGMFLYAAAVWWVVLRDPKAGPAGEKMRWDERLKALAGVWSVILLFGVVMGGIYGGFFSPTESAGIGAFGALLIAALRGRLSWTMLRTSLADGISTTVTLMIILIGSFLFANLVNVARLPQALVSTIESADVPAMAVIFAIILIYVILGCVLESISMMLLTVPVFYPLIVSLGFDPIWFGVLVVVVVEISLITPPIGLNVFILNAVLKDVQLTDIFRGVVPFIFADVVRVLLVVFIPALSLTLPYMLN
ncbi:TRAP transporter large permease [Thalassobius sp. S69A]|uniref:TRAP transporter large permease n=1 Tax=unclassified Thalassovita TaxID=2619711 RepID=UPI000C11F399|nr:C4-dicarboxylate ABC transporter permease [Paracoccaceae bacterium]MBT25908.1 C4-dicarboxylate ABC transporter permease [Paracoccaceae bacterium]